MHKIKNKILFYDQSYLNWELMIIISQLIAKLMPKKFLI